MESLGVIMGQLLQCISVVVQFYPWFRFDFLLFQTHYHTLLYPKRKERKRILKPRIKLNHNIVLYTQFS